MPTPTLEGVVRRLALNQSATTGALEELSGEKLTFPQGLAAQVRVAVFVDTPSSTTFVPSVNFGDVDSATLVVRKNGPNGGILFVKEVTTFDLSATYATWVDNTKQVILFDVTSTDTTQTVPSSGRLQVYFTVTIKPLTGDDYLAGFGYGEIVNVGYIENPDPQDYVDGALPIRGGKLLTDLDLNGFNLINSGDTISEEGRETLTEGQLTVSVIFQYEKPDLFRFDYLYIVDQLSGVPRDIRPCISFQNYEGFVVQLTAGASAGSYLYWKVIPLLSLPSPSPAPRFGIVPNSGDTVTYAIWDKGGQFFNVMAYGADNTGATNITARVQEAVDAAAEVDGCVYFPSGDFWVEDLEVPENVSICGAGRKATRIGPAIGGATAMKLGVDGGAQWRGKLSNFCVARGVGTLPGNTIGINVLHASYGVIEDVEIAKHDVGIKMYNALGLVLNRVYINNCVIHAWVKDSAEVFIDKSNFGANGGEDVEPEVLVLIDGTTNDLRIQSTQFIPRVNPNSTVCFKFINCSVGTTPGYYRFHDINLEQVAIGFQTDATGVDVSDLTVTGSRLTPTKLFDWHTSTKLRGATFATNGAFNTVTPCTIGIDASGCRCVGNVVSGNLTFNGGDWIVGINDFATSVHFVGDFVALNMTSNSGFNQTGPVLIDIGSATGNITCDLNSTTDGTSLPRIVNGKTIDELITGERNSASVLALTNNTRANITSISLSPGIWEIGGFIGFQMTSGTPVTSFVAGASAVSATFGDETSYAEWSLPFSPTSFIGHTIQLPRKSYTLGVTTTIYLVGKANFASGSVGGYGQIRARRVFA